MGRPSVVGVSRFTDLPTTRPFGAPVTDDEARVWLPLVERVARPYLRRAPRRYHDDLHSAAALGLVLALTSWEGGHKLDSHVATRVMSAVKDELRRIYGRRRDDGTRRVGTLGHSYHEVGVVFEDTNEKEDSAGWDGAERRTLAPAAPDDPEADVVELDRQRRIAALLDKVKALTDPGKWDDLVANEIQRVALRIIAERDGVSENAISQRNAVIRRRAVKHLRDEWESVA